MDAGSFSGFVAVALFMGQTHSSVGVGFFLVTGEKIPVFFNEPATGSNCGLKSSQGLFYATAWLHLFVC